MKKVIALLLFLISSPAWSTPCLTPGIALDEIRLTMDGAVAHFRTLISGSPVNDCTVSGGTFFLLDFDFGDGQTQHGGGFDVFHTYQPGSFLATETVHLFADYVAPNIETCFGNNQTDCTPVSHSFREVITQQFNITVVPEPETYALMLAGLSLFGWVGRRRKRRAA